MGGKQHGRKISWKEMFRQEDKNNFRNHFSNWILTNTHSFYLLIICPLDLFFKSINFFFFFVIFEKRIFVLIQWFKKIASVSRKTQENIKDSIRKVNGENRRRNWFLVVAGMQGKPQNTKELRRNIFFKAT